MNPGGDVAAGYQLATDSRGESFLYLSGTVQFLPWTTLDFKEFVEFPCRSSLPSFFGIFQTEVYEQWFDSVRDRQARGRAGGSTRRR